MKTIILYLVNREQANIGLEKYSLKLTNEWIYKISVVSIIYAYRM